MTNTMIAKLLAQHSVPYYEQDGHIYADTMCSGLAVFEDVEDLTGFSRSELLNWLGY